MSDYVLLLDQISPFLESQFSNLPKDLQERISQAGMGEKTKEKICAEAEEFDWAHIEAENKYLTGEEAKEIEESEGVRKGKGIRSKITTEHYYIWDTLSALQREYKVARYDFENCPNHREKAASEKLIETITPYLEKDFSELPQEIKMSIAYVDDFQLWNEKDVNRCAIAEAFDIHMLPDGDPNVLIGFYDIRDEWDKRAKKKVLLAEEAIPLMNGLDPESWEEHKNDQKNLPIDMIRSINRCLEIAKAEGKHIATPSEWLTWGRLHDLDKPTIRSHELFPEPDVCMWKFFESAVIKHVKETNKSRDSDVEQESKQSKTAKSKGAGRPKSVEKNAAILKQIIEILTEGKNINPARLLGGAKDLHDACKQIAKAKSKKNMFSASLSTFKVWLKATGYGFGNGRTPSVEVKYWTKLSVENIGKIDSEIFTKDSSENLLYPAPTEDAQKNET